MRGAAIQCARRVDLAAGSRLAGDALGTGCAARTTSAHSAAGFASVCPRLHMRQNGALTARVLQSDPGQRRLSAPPDRNDRRDAVHSRLDVRDRQNRVHAHLRVAQHTVQRSARHRRIYDSGDRRRRPISLKRIDAAAQALVNVHASDAVFARGRQKQEHTIRFWTPRSERVRSLDADLSLAGVCRIGRSMPVIPWKAAWRTVCGLRLRGSRSKRLLHSPGSSTTGLV